MHTLYGGIEVKTPRTWRIDSSVKALAGGVDVHAPPQDDGGAPVLTLEGMAVFGGIEVGG